MVTTAFSRADCIFLVILGITTLAEIVEWIFTRLRKTPPPPPAEAQAVPTTPSAGGAVLANNDERLDPLFREILKKQIEVEKLNNPSTFVEYAKTSRALNKLQKEWDEKFGNMTLQERQPYLAAMRARNMNMEVPTLAEAARVEGSSSSIGSADSSGTANAVGLLGSPFSALGNLGFGLPAGSVLTEGPVSIGRIMSLLSSGASGGGGIGSLLSPGAHPSQSGVQVVSVQILKFIKNPIRLLCCYLAVHWLSGMRFSLAISRLPILSLPRSFFWPLSQLSYSTGSAGFPMSLFTRVIENGLVQSLVLAPEETQGISAIGFGEAPPMCREYVTFGLLTSISLVSIAVYHLCDELSKARKFFRTTFIGKQEPSSVTTPSPSPRFNNKED